MLSLGKQEHNIVYQCLTSDVGESVPGDGAIPAVEVEIEKSTFPVTVIELIADVPAQRTKLLPLLQHRHERRHTQTQT